ncbi:MAG: 3-hydroxyacyl-CoA dehydrogenase family protein [Bacteroidales bacterium]|nr:3-hydroxyacyl-CoA dehydrogenase family protein [Bacteroidales bacterium]
MTYEERIQNVSVLGAAGKMGSGILLLTAVEMANLSLKPENKGKTFVLNAIDLSDEGLAGLRPYIQAQVRKIAEKQTVWLRSVYADRADLIQNGEIIEQYIFDVLNIIRPTTAMEVAYRSSLIFEAVSENPELKVKILSQIDQNNKNQAWYFTNTSSVPIHLIEDKANLTGRVLGFHFYNPPAVQKLVEVITTPNTSKEMVEFASAYAKALRKITVPANDIAGFIGNGHFMRDGLHGLSEATKLSAQFSWPEAVYMMNKVTQDYLVRPMGIFQLMDYVGIDVMQFIMKVMNPYMSDETIHSDVIDQFMELGVKGGQMSSGAQKDGFLKYEKGKPVAAYDPSTKSYISFADFAEKCDAALGAMPDGAVVWKAALRLKNKEEVFSNFFANMKKSDALGAKLGAQYGARSNAIGQKLVSDGVAANAEDVNTVMLTGFFHAFGPVNTYFD